MSNQPDDQDQGADSNPPDDFTNFDPAAYVRKHREEVGHGYLNEDLTEDPLPNKRGRQKVSDIEEPIGQGQDDGDLGLGAALLGGMGRFGRGGMGGMGGGYGPGGGYRSGRRFGLMAELLGSFGPARRLIMFILTILLFLACVGTIAIVYVVTTLTRR
jgi:hypothetical protein